MNPAKPIRIAGRLRDLPPYLFAEIDRLRDMARAGGVDVIDLGVGDPDMPTLAPIVEAMEAALGDPANHRYPAYEGTYAFRKSSADYVRRRTGVRLDPEREVLALIGSKDGIAHLPLAFIDPGDVALVPDPGYPVYTVATRFCGGEAVPVPLLEENGFLPDLDRIPARLWRRAKILFLNYPNNPTGARATREFFERAIELAARHGVLIAHDAAYFEIYAGRSRPLSILELEGGREVAIEFFSHSKSYNMTGWRIGFAAGAPRAVEALGRVKNNLDSGVFTAIQKAAATANGLPAKWRDGVRRVYARRRRLAVRLLGSAGFDVFDAGATFYVWARVPEGLTANSFAVRALSRAGVVVTPGSGFGEFGEAYFRLALCTGEARIREAVERLGRIL